MGMFRIILELKDCALKIHELHIIKHLTTLESVNIVMEKFLRTLTRCILGIFVVFIMVQHAWILKVISSNAISLR